MSYTPRHLRRRGNTSRNGTVGPEKSQAFRQAKREGDKFRHQSSSMLEKPSVYPHYAEYKRKTDAANGNRRDDSNTKHS